MSETVYEQLGGDAGLEQVVSAFYERVLDDERLVAHFGDTDMDALRQHQRDFLAMATGGPTDYSGPDMRAVHADLNLQPADFAAITGHLRMAMQECDVAPPLQETVIRVVAGLEDDVLDR